MHKPRDNHTGFTIVELLIVIVVIGILAAISIVAYNGIQSRAAEVSIRTNLRGATNQLEIDYQLTGLYPASLLLANGGKGLTAGNGMNYQYSYDAIANTYCLTAVSTQAKISAYHVTNIITTPVQGACAGHSEAGEVNLVTNGRGDMGNNTNFSSFVFNGSDAPTGSQGSFISPNGNYSFYVSTEFMTVDQSHQYILRGWARQRTAGVSTSRWYLALDPYDVDNKAIRPQNYMYRPSTTTTLTQTLNPGDSVVYLANVSTSWYDTAGASTHWRSLIFWNYTDSTGKTWPPETYSQNPWYSDIYSGGVGAIDRTANTITLNKPWPGGVYPVGQAVSNGGAAGTYMYAAAASNLLTNAWQEWVSSAITGTTSAGLNGSTNTFPLATRSVRISIGVNSGSPPLTSRQAVGGIRFYDISQ